MASHLFLVHGDIMALDCDAWLLPGGDGWPGQTWAHAVGDRPMGDPSRSRGKKGARVVRWTPRVEGHPQPWLVDLGGSPETPIAWYVDGAREFLEAVSADLKGGSPRRGRARHLVAMPLVGTGQGGKRREAGAVAVELLPALYTFAEASEIDIALVMIEGATYSAVQAERRDQPEERVWAALEPRFRKKADGLAHKASAGELVLFFGAGVSVSAGVPLWRELIDEVAREHAEMTEDVRRQLDQLSPLDRAHVIQRRLGPSRPLSQTVADFVRTRSSHYALSHVLLATLPVEAMVTTNYDTLFERASASAMNPVAVLPYDRVRENQRWLLKLHGCVEHPEDIVLTRDDYLAYRERREALAGIVQALLITKHMLFVGFSLEDDNFHQIMRAVRRAMRLTSTDERRDEGHGRPFGTSLIIEGNPLVEELWRGDLEWVHLGGKATDAKETARRLEIFLDRVGASAHNASAHLFDPRYANVLSEGEREVRDLLESLYEKATAEAKATKAWVEIERLLGKLGRERRRRQRQ